MKGTVTLMFLAITSIIFGQEADSSRIEKHLKKIINTDDYRNINNPAILNEVAAYIHDHFLGFTDSVWYQKFELGGVEYKNVIASFNTTADERIIVGAHYDVCGDQDGADDNASAVAALLELAELLNQNTGSKRIDLVAFTLEEPPAFGSNNMGSYHHAKYLKEINANVLGMVCMDMIGYYNSERGSQKYPLGILKLFYGSRGDYITAVQKFRPGKFAKTFTKRFKKKSRIKTKKFKGPEKLRGISFSDHYHYWNQGYSSVFLTNTGFYRNQNYHLSGDSLGTLNLTNIEAVTDALYQSLISF